MSTIQFKNLDRKLQIELSTIPQCVSTTKNPDSETNEQALKRQEKFLTLSENIKDKLVSYETSNKIQEIGKQYNLQLLQLADISRTIRSYYFGEIHLEDFPSILYKEMGMDLNVAKEISQLVINKIINDNSQEERYQAQLTKILITDALRNHPELLDQLITTQPIYLSGHSEPVRPSIKNWLSDYTYNLGYDAHNSIVRGNYVFQNENAKTLSNSDRQKLSYILKSYDEKTPVTVDTARKQIIFPAMAGEQKTYSAPKPTPAQPIERPNNFSQQYQNTDIRTAPIDLRQNPTTAPKNNETNPEIVAKKDSTVSKPVYNLEHIQSDVKPIRPRNYSDKPQFQNNLRQNYDHPPVHERPAFNSAPTAQSENIKFSSPQKLPYEKEKEKNYYSPRVPANLPTAPTNQTPPEQIFPQKPAPPTEPAPEPLRIHPVSSNGYGEEKREELPKNVVNLKEQ